jgi:hypothetical protein
VEAERLTRLDRMLIAESRERGMVDLRLDAAESYTADSYLGRTNQHLLIDRAKRLERYGLATETEPGNFSFGHTRVCQPEDFPVVPVEYAGFMLKRNGFFDANPSCDLPVEKNARSIDARAPA